ncbi:MAG: ABC transporter ATP-binding protein [Inquilinus sp.]|nr:ABC transporter ATP-binding protein [Inquilinus sp.]
MPILEFREITKRFGDLVANDRISLSVEAGEILALLGENGAGKTTLMNILFGHYTADAGSVLVEGAEVPPGSTMAALAAGIGMVHQHFTLAGNLTVLDNIVLGTEPLRALRQNRAAARAKLARLAGDFGLAVAPDKPVGDLSVGERQRVEILKALYRDARILILDEPTAVLTPQEADDLFATLKRLTAKGLSIIFISHKLHEILKISDRVVVLRRGRIVGAVATAEADRAMLAEMMVGRAVTRPSLEPMAAGAPVLELAGVSVFGGHGPALDRVDLTIRAHEIVGIAGVAGNGQGALAGLLSGLSRPDAGSVALFGETLTRFSPRDMVRRGVGRIPEDRHASGVVGDMAVWENLVSETLSDPPASRGRAIIDKAACLDRTARLIEAYDIRCEGPLAQTKLLSGGNMQKLILARALSPEPTFILANQPVRGLDEGAIAYVQTRLLEARRGGAGILLISEDLDEVLALSDRVAVLYHGRLSGPFDRAEVTIQQIGLMMAGHAAVGSGARAEPAHAD